MPPLGSHMSIAGGLHKAVERGIDVGCDCIQIFSKNNAQWKAGEIRDEEARQFRDAVVAKNIAHTLVHASYLINLATPDQELRGKSVDALVVELQRAAKLGIPHVVVHPGAFISGTEEAGLKRVVRALDEIARRTKGLSCNLLLETTAGQGTSLGCRFEHLARMLDGARHSERLGVCFDTCHVFAAGYDLRTRSTFRSTIDEFDEVVGLSRIKAFHVNDSRSAFGSRVDRHEHIGRGNLGTSAFRMLLNEPRFRHTPMYLETAKGECDGEDWDLVNLRTLRGLIRR
jgi:deoxyribonuclease-4